MLKALQRLGKIDSFCYLILQRAKNYYLTSLISSGKTLTALGVIDKRFATNKAVYFKTLSMLYETMGNI